MRIGRRFLIILLLALGLLSDACGDEPIGLLSEGPITVSAPQARGATGDVVAVPIMVKGASGLGCLQIALVYDERLLEVQGVDKGSLLGERAIFDWNKAVPGRLGLGFLSGPDSRRTQLAHITGDGPVFNVRFKVLGRPGERSPLNPERGQAWQVNDEKLALRTATGDFLITGAPFPWPFGLLAVVCVLLLGVVLRRAGRRAPKSSL